MSVNARHYLIYGVKMTAKQYNEKYNIEENEYIHSQYWKSKKQKKGDLIVVVDGMSQEYAIIGKLVASTYESYEGFPMTVFNQQTFDEQSVRVELKEKFAIDHNLTLNFLLFTHYS